MGAIKQEITEEVEGDKVLRLLILDDDPKILTLLNAILKKKFIVSAASTLSDLMLHAEVNRPDLILLDLSMPNIDGFEVLSIVKNHSSTATTPVICISADGTVETRNRIRNEGANGFIKKPFKSDTLISDIETVLASLDKVIESDNKRRKFFITHNDHKKYELIHQSIEESSKLNEQVIFLSWIEGKDFLTPYEEELIKNDKLIFLEIKPSLIVKFPYIQEVSPVFEDIQKFSFKETGPKHLIFDEIRNILNVYDQERALAKTYSMASYLKTSFSKTSMFNTKPSMRVNSLLLEKIARIFTGMES